MSSNQPIALTPSTAGFGSTGFQHEKGYRERLASAWDSLVQLYKSNIGLLLIILSQLSGTCMVTIVKLLNRIDPPVPTFEIIFIRMFITWLFCISVMSYTSVPHPIAGPPGVRALLIIRGVSGFFGLFGLYYSVQYLSLSDAITISFLVPTTTAIAGYLLLNEAIGRKELLAGAFSFVGVVLIARPEFLFGSHQVVPVEGIDLPPAEKGTNAERLVAVGVALLGVLGATGAFISIRAVGKRAHPLHSVSYFSIWCCIVSSIGMIVLRIPVVIPEKPLFAVLLLVIGIFGFITQVTLTMGLQRETASRGSLALYTQILFAAVAERFIFHATPSYLSILGITIIITCALYVVVTKKSDSGNKAPNQDIDMPEHRENHDDLEEEDIHDESYGLVSGTKRAWNPDLEHDAENNRHSANTHV